ncbi:MAG: molybdate ABC transporter substrate-binding protein [Methylobacteriaceae bacterium]|nr:molybdate ABC transporter substrate-binding protein [Methylobacteriaceae bacterium]
MNSKALAFAGFLASAIAIAPAQAQTQNVTIFAAASLKTALDDIAAQWQKDTGKSAKISYVASGPLAKQIEAGAPADIFISADVPWMDYVAERKLIKAETRRNLLGNALVLVAPADSKTQATPLNAQTDLNALLGSDGRLAIGEPKSVPAGNYAEKALTSLGLWDKVKDRLAQAESVRATLLFVARGEAPAGIVYRSDARAEPKVKVVATFPDSSHPPILYPIAMIAASTNPDAKAFYDYLATPAASAIFKRESFDVLPSDARKAASAEQSDCDGVAWSLARERQWFADAATPTVESGAILKSNGAEHLVLSPVSAVQFPAKSDRKLKEGTFGGVFPVAALDKPGLHQITASDEAWIDVSPDGKSVAPSVAHSSAKNCPGLRKSVRFDLSGPVSIQIMNAPSRTLDLAIAPAN